MTPLLLLFVAMLLLTFSQWGLAILVFFLAMMAGKSNSKR